MTRLPPRKWLRARRGHSLGNPVLPKRLLIETQLRLVYIGGMNCCPASGTAFTSAAED
jgi:hypothetical protein